MSRTINEDQLDLSSGAGSIISGAGSSTEDDVDVLSIDPPSPSNVEHWSIEKVAEFVSNVESCREYAQVIKKFFSSNQSAYFTSMYNKFQNLKFESRLF